MLQNIALLTSTGFSCSTVGQCWLVIIWCACWKQQSHSCSLAYFFSLCAFFTHSKLKIHLCHIYCSYIEPCVISWRYFHKIFINLHMKWDISGNLIFFDLYIFLKLLCYHDDWYVKPFGILCRWVLWLFLLITFILFELLRFKNNPIDINCIYLCYCIQSKLHSYFRLLSIAHWSTVPMLIIMTCTVHELLGGI